MAVYTRRNPHGGEEETIDERRKRERDAGAAQATPPPAAQASAAQARPQQFARQAGPDRYARVRASGVGCRGLLDPGHPAGRLDYLAAMGLLEN